MEDFKWFLGLLAIVAVVWFTGRGATSKTVSTDTASSTPVTETTTNTLTETDPPQKTTSLGQKSVQPPIDPNASPLKGRLSIVSYSRGSSADQEYVLIQASRTNEKPVLITGLTIGSGVSLSKQSIPKAWTLPFLSARGEGDLVALSPGERAYIISGHSPLSVTQSSGETASFQLNTCTGFLGQNTPYYPSLPRGCPAPSSETLPSNGYELSYGCVEYLKRIPVCTVPGSLPQNLSGDMSCSTYVATKINYTQCVTNHKNDEHFYKGEWRMYLGRTSPLWRSSRESIELRDMQGKLIDVRTY